MVRLLLLLARDIGWLGWTSELLALGCWLTRGPRYICAWFLGSDATDLGEAKAAASPVPRLAVSCEGDQAEMTARVSGRRGNCS